MVPNSGLPGQYQRTGRFTHGAPHSFVVAENGSRVAFLRSRNGRDALTSLWTIDIPSGVEHLIADPSTLMSGPPDGLTPTERQRSERRRETTTGITAFATDRELQRAVFSRSGHLWVADLDIGRAFQVCAKGHVAAPVLNPDGSHIAYLSDGALRIIDIEGANDRELVAPESVEVSYGLPEYVAAESMGRHTGYWWSPEGTQLLVTRVDTAHVPQHYLSDPSEPTAQPAEIRYPVAGSNNADVSLWIFDSAGNRRLVEWDRRAFEYLVSVKWGRRGGPVAVVQSRDQRTVRILAIDASTGKTAVIQEDTDPRWVRVTPGTPAYTDNGALVWTANVDGAMRLYIEGAAVTPSWLEVREVHDVDGDTVLFAASIEPTEIGLWTHTAGSVPRALLTTPGVHRGRRAGGTTVVVSETLNADRSTATVHRAGHSITTIASHAEIPMTKPRVELLRAGELELRTALLLPTGHEPGTRCLPVLLDPYGGPSRQRVLAARGQYSVSQWFADQGFAVVIADGRGTLGRGGDWERSVYGDKGTLPLADQITALHSAADQHPDLDLGRVAIRGWSFGGYLAALAVLRRPDVFHAAVAGAPVTDQLLYDTYWNERFLGHPANNSAAYKRSSLLADAERLRRPLMLIHGLADDNVLAAHTVRLSTALTATGRLHTALLVPGMTHRPGRFEEELLLLQAEFLKTALERDQP